MSGLEGGKSIFDIYENIGETRNQIEKLDTSLTNSMSKNSKEIIQTIKSWQSDTSSAISKAVSSAVSQVGGGYRTADNTSTYSSTGAGNSSSDNITYTIQLDTGMGSCQVKYVKKGESLTLPSLTRSGYTFTGWDIPSLGICTMGSYTYKPTQNETVKAMWKAVQSTSILPTYTNAFSSNTGINLPVNPYSMPHHANGGLVNYTGPSWLDGSPQNPEMVLNALQTKHFIKFVDVLDKVCTNNIAGNSASSVSIDNISFNVDSMSSVEDGEKAFDAFVNKFKEIGNQTGIKINSFKNTL